MRRLKQAWESSRSKKSIYSKAKSFFPAQESVGCHGEFFRQKRKYRPQAPPKTTHGFETFYQNFGNYIYRDRIRNYFAPYAIKIDKKYKFHCRLTLRGTKHNLDRIKLDGFSNLFVILKVKYNPMTYDRSESPKKGAQTYRQKVQTYFLVFQLSFRLI